MSDRWGVEHYGMRFDEWCVYEYPSGGRTKAFPPILSWLTEKQACAIADLLNDVAGYNWQERHPDWNR